MQKHAGALGTWSGERRIKRILFLWDPTVGAVPRGMLCRTEGKDILEENLIETKCFAPQGFLQGGVRLSEVR